MKKHPKFQRQNFHTFGRVKDNWRKPRGIDSKQRKKWKNAGALPNAGYRTAKATRDVHPSGFREVLVHNEAEVRKAPNGVAVRFAGGVGAKKRAVLKKIAVERKLKILNA